MTEGLQASHWIVFWMGFSMPIMGWIFWKLVVAGERLRKETEEIEAKIKALEEET